MFQHEKATLRNEVRWIAANRQRHSNYLRKIRFAGEEFRAAEIVLDMIHVQQTNLPICNGIERNKVSGGARTEVLTRVVVRSEVVVVVEVVVLAEKVVAMGSKFVTKEDFQLAEAAPMLEIIAALHLVGMKEDQYQVGKAGGVVMRDVLIDGTVENPTGEPEGSLVMMVDDNGVRRE